MPSWVTLSPQPRSLALALSQDNDVGTWPTATWRAFIRTHLALLAGTDFFTTEVLTLRGLITYYVLFFIHLASRRMDIAGITIHPDERPSWNGSPPIAKTMGLSKSHL
jgi:hypothetical protein